jgi:hypothetical protein
VCKIPSKNRSYFQFTGAGIFKSLDDSGNVLILIDEFDGEHQKSNIFNTDSKAGSTAL